MVTLLSAGDYARLNIVDRLLADRDSRLPQTADALRLDEVGLDDLRLGWGIDIDALLRQPHAVVALGIVAVVHDAPPSYCQSLDQLDYSISHNMPHAHNPENIINLDFWIFGIGKFFYQRTPNANKKICRLLAVHIFVAQTSSRY